VVSHTLVVCLTLKGNLLVFKDELANVNETIDIISLVFPGSENILS